MTIAGTAPLSRQLSPTVLQIPSYDRQMMEATLNASPTSPFPASKSPSSSSSTAASPTSNTSEDESRRLNKDEPNPGVKNLWGLISNLSPTSSHSNEDKPKSRTPTAPIDRPPSPPVPKVTPQTLPSSDEKASSPPQNGFVDDPMGLGITDLPTLGHADKMQKSGERKVKLGSLLRSGKMQAQGQYLLAKSDMIRAQAVELTKDEKKGTTVGKQAEAARVKRRGTL